MHIRFTFILGLVGLITAPLCACNSSANQPIPTSQSTDKHAHEIRPRSAGKPSAPIDITYQLSGTPAVSVPLKISINFKPLVPAHNLNVSYHMQGALTGLDPVSEVNIPDPATGKLLTQTVEVLPQAEGLHYVSVSATLEDANGQLQNKSIMIPVAVGEKAKLNPEHPNKTHIQQDPQGNPIIVLPAQESH
ncbi:MAG: hypothetical protein HY080_14425 [Gammaproteobacteria bacterium]|nr:hypothetical protein [Gammaproteobacteria bacterium]